MNQGKGIKYDPKTNKVSIIKGEPLVKSNIEMMLMKTISEQERRKMAQDAINSMKQKKKKPSVGQVLKQTLKSAFKKKPKKKK